MWLGRANTGGDAEVWVPDVKVLATGDTVVSPIPFAFGSYMSEWPDVLQKMMDLHPTVIVPGHGPVMHDDSYMRTLQAICREIVAEVRASDANHATVEELRKKLKLDEYMTQLYGDNKRKKSEFLGTFVEPGLDRALQEAKGQLKPEGMDE